MPGLSSVENSAAEEPVTENLHLQKVLLDHQAEFARATNSIGTPTTLFYDRNGKLVDSRIGELSAATSESLLAKLG